MRIESSVTSLSWIPSEAVKGMTKLPFEMGMAHYDPPPPDGLAPPDDLESLRAADRFRFANELRAWIEVEGDEVVGAGYAGSGMIGSTTVGRGKASMTFEAVALPDLRPEPEVGNGAVRFVQTAGGRTGVPAPRRVRHAPFVQWSAPLAWSTLALTIRTDGTSSHEVVGASPFPRHWIYDEAGELAGKTGLIDFKTWYRDAFGKHSPWGDADSPALVTEVETALERTLSNTLMRGGAKPKVKKLKPDATLVEQGDEGTDLFLLLDGVLRVEVDGEALADLGPGAVLGERAVLEEGRRTCTLRAVTPCKVAVARGVDIDREALNEVSTGHRREEGR
ncbi:MAG: cyclic nucleotide-binding domain-containing protein [Actinomycetota bacterium]|nr:cyclic nucleotide-binding domain-containing protein [Actinomycetota bacterium]